MCCSTWLIDKTLTGTTISGQGGAESDGNKGVLHILQTPVMIEGGVKENKKERKKERILSLHLKATGVF